MNGSFFSAGFGFSDDVPATPFGQAKSLANLSSSQQTFTLGFLIRESNNSCKEGRFYSKAAYRAEECFVFYIGMCTAFTEILR